LESLTNLDLFSNAITDLPLEFGKKFSALEILNIHSNKLRSLPESIGAMVQLSVLNLNDNILSQIPTSIGSLVALEQLDISSNMLTDLPSEIGNLGSLVHFNVSKNAISSKDVAVIEKTTIIVNNTSANFTTGKSIDRNSTFDNSTDGNATGSKDMISTKNYTMTVSSLPSEIGRLSSMLTLDLHLNHLVFLPTEIGRLDALELLDISSNMLTNLPSEVGNLQSLRYLNLAENALSSREFDAIENVTLGNFTENAATNVTLTYTVVDSSIPSELGRLDVVSLNLSSNNLAVVPSELGLLSSLELLDLSSNMLSGLPTELANLQSLEYLDLSSNALTSREDTVLKNLTATNSTDGFPIDDLSGSSVTTVNYTVVISSIPRLSPSLKILDLSSNNLVVLPAEIGSLDALEWFFVNSNQLTKLPRDVGSLKSLERLELQNNTLSSLPTEVGDLENLSVLDVSWNALSDLPSEVGKLTKLSYLDVSYNGMVGTWSPTGIEVSTVIGSLETCLSDSELETPSCQLFCCRLETSFCETEC